MQLLLKLSTYNLVAVGNRHFKDVQQPLPLTNYQHIQNRKIFSYVLSAVVRLRPLASRYHHQLPSPDTSSHTKSTSKYPSSPSSLSPIPTKKPLLILFDLGLQQKHLETRKPHALFPGAPETLVRNVVELDSINLVVLSHVHYDHHGDPELFTNAKFVVGPGAVDVLKNCPTA